MTNARKVCLRALMLSSALMAPATMLAMPAAAAAQPTETAVSLNIPAQDLGSALTEFARQSRQQLLYSPQLVRGKRSTALAGRYSPEAGLRQLLAGTDIQVSTASSGAFLLSAAGNVDAGGEAGVADENAAAGSSDEGEEIIVTGTNIRGLAPESSPVRVFRRSDIERSGAATAQEFIAKLPENFGGGSNPAIPAGLPGDDSAGANSAGFGSFGSSVNLRGLGSGSTLVLLNGHRVAPSSVNGDFADISMIPASAIERVETLTDGASSIYGSDAVAGVVNFILRDDFDGLETSLRYGTGTEGGTPDQVRVSVTAGKNWGSGHGLIVYEHFDQDRLSVEDRDFARKDFAPSFLLPSQKRNSLFASVSQDVASRLEVFGDILYSRRKARQIRTDLTAPGLTFQYDAVSKSVSASAGASWGLTDNWFVDVSGVYGRVDTRNTNSGPFPDKRESDSKVWNVDARISGPLVALPAGNVKIAAGADYREERLTVTNLLTDVFERGAKRTVRALYGEAFIPLIGPANSLPGLRRLEANVSARYSDYSDFGSSFDPKIGILYSPAEGLNLRGSYSTSFKAPALGRVGAIDLGASLFRTSFIFPIFGLTPADPSLADVILLTVSGTDNDLDPETSRAFTLGADLSRSWGDQRFSASATWFDINYRNRLGNVPIPGNVIHFDAINIAFDDPTAFPAGSFTFQPSPEEVDSLLASLETPFLNPFGLDPYQTFFLSRLLIITNTSRTIARGLDFRMSYSRPVGNGTLNVGIDGTYLRDFRRQAAATTPPVQQINSLYQPVDLKLRGQLAYSGRNLSAAMFVNYVDSYKVNRNPGAASIDSWTTFDVTATFDTRDDLGPPLLRNTALRLSVSNLFDEDPPRTPFVSNLRVDGYDPTNASPLGRFVSLELIKRF